MNLSESNSRRDELAAGRALGNLDAAERLELEAMDLQPDVDFDLLAASLEVQAALRANRPLPPLLKKRLHALADETAAKPPEPVIVPMWKRIVSHPATGWLAAAAAVVLAFVAPRGNVPATPETSAARLRAEATDLIERGFSGLGDFKQASGSVVWSDTLQSGSMTLAGIPANDPTKAQYQLWIVDPARDADAPVDGGVFDIPAGSASVVIPIDAKLAIRGPQAFVITLEQPGGVVKSKQEKVVALAKL